MSASACPSSTSSYSRRPSWVRVRPPADTNRRGREGSLGKLPLAALGPASGYRGEGAFGDAALGGMGERKAGPEPVVAARVVESGRHPDQLLTGPELERGHDLHDLPPDPAPAGHAGRPREAPPDTQSAPDRSGFEHLDLRRLGAVDELVPGPGGE